MTPDREGYDRAIRDVVEALREQRLEDGPRVWVAPAEFIESRFGSSPAQDDPQGWDGSGSGGELRERVADALAKADQIADGSPYWLTLADAALAAYDGVKR